MKKPIEKFVFTQELKEHYKFLHGWLLKNPTIEFKKLHPYGLQINVGTIPEDAAEEFLRICYQHETKTE